MDTPTPGALSVGWRPAGPDDAATFADVYLASFGATHDVPLAYDEQDVRRWIGTILPPTTETWVAVTAGNGGKPERIGAGTPAQVGLVVVVGLGTGVVTQIGQAWLPSEASQVANAISPWLLVAFLVGAAMPDPLRAALAGAAALLLALVGYNAMLLVQLGYASSASATLFWAIGALVGGPVFGTAGRLWRVGSDSRRAAALGLLVAVFVLDGLYQALVVSYPYAGAGFVIAGLLVPLVLGGSRGVTGRAYLAALPALGLGIVGYLAFAWLYGLITGV